jgi:hypothetical protein
MTFAEAYTALLDYAHRDVNDLGDAAKREINAAVLWANRKRGFKMAEGLANITYPANQEYIILAEVCSATVFNLITVELLVNLTDTSGQPLPIKQYQDLQRLRMEANDNQPIVNPAFFSSTMPAPWQVEFSTKVQNEYGYMVVLIAGGFGLWPIPPADVPIKILFNKQLPPLVDDEDTNFFLENCWDFILLKAMKRFNYYLKADQRINVSNEELQNEWVSIENWDSALRRRQY